MPEWISRAGLLRLVASLSGIGHVEAIEHISKTDYRRGESATALGGLLSLAISPFPTTIDIFTYQFLRREKRNIHAIKRHKKYVTCLSHT